MRLIHLTDPHLSSLENYSFRSLRGKRRSGYLSWYRKRRHVHRMDILQELTDAVASYSPDQILLTGDLVHIGLDSEIAEAAEWLHRLGPPDKVLLIPGNHDNYANDSQEAMARHWSDYLPADFQSGEDYTAGFPLVRQCADVQLIGVNTACVTPIFSATGKLGTAQTQRLASALKKQPTSDFFQCLLIHHPPLPGMAKRRKALQDAAALATVFAGQPPDLVLYGHLHHNREVRDGQVRCFCTSSASDINDASFRIIDIEKDNAGWHCRVRLMKIEKKAGTSVVFKLFAESSWRR